jgi:hypothetical protein
LKERDEFGEGWGKETKEGKDKEQTVGLTAINMPIQIIPQRVIIGTLTGSLTQPHS